jgi:hypothetical protein
MVYIPELVNPTLTRIHIISPGVQDFGNLSSYTCGSSSSKVKIGRLILTAVYCGHGTLRGGVLQLLFRCVN